MTITTTSTVDTSLWLRRFHPAPDAPVRLVCLPHAGGSASYYHPVSRALTGVEVFAVQYPGRQDRRAEPCIDTVHGLAARVAEQVATLADRPIALFGHSMGASVAFEVARLLEEDGIVLKHLFASGRRAPSRHRDEHIHQLGDNGLIAEMRRLNGTEGKLLDDDELIRMIIGAIRNDYKAAETYVYRPGPPLSCPITVMTGDSDPKVTVDEADSWRTHTTGPYAMKVYRGGHFYLNNHQTDILETIVDRLTAG
ncbi:thioesterase II family protein [Micromonospora zamorensis]|uniref:thioesterase II family protein n=1 Tax=Micromonospora TaxID=1873 RepID=UPI0023790670|nr:MULTISPECIES: alpha/beta fold hydrolase [Micromonospora]